MNIKLTKELILRQAELIQHVSTRIDEKTGDTIFITISSCQDLIAKIYGFKSGTALLIELANEKSRKNK